MAVCIRQARAEDLVAIVDMLADDALGQTREVTGSVPDPRYQQAFTAIDEDPNHLLVVAELDGQLAGCLQLSFIPGLSRTGMWRGQIESVRVHGAHRGHQIGTQLVAWAIAASERRGCGLVQLTTDKARAEALRFYEALGFRASHEGMKLSLSD